MIFRALVEILPRCFIECWVGRQLLDGLRELLVDLHRDKGCVAREGVHLLNNRFALSCYVGG